MTHDEMDALFAMATGASDNRRRRGARRHGGRGRPVNLLCERTEAQDSSRTSRLPSARRRRLSHVLWPPMRSAQPRQRSTTGVHGDGPRGRHRACSRPRPFVDRSLDGVGRTTTPARRSAAGAGATCSASVTAYQTRTTSAMRSCCRRGAAAGQQQQQQQQPAPHLDGANGSGGSGSSSSNGSSSSGGSDRVESGCAGDGG